MRTTSTYLTNLTIRQPLSELKWRVTGKQGRQQAARLCVTRGKNTRKETRNQQPPAHPPNGTALGSRHTKTMFAIKSLSKYLFGDASKENIVELPQGQLYIVRPLSIKGYSELIFRDSAAFIRRTGQEFQYQLVIQRAYEEGEAELDEEEAQEGGGVAASDKDERVFLLDEDLRLRVDLRDTGETILAWRDLSGDHGDLFEFVCDSATRPEVAAGFELVAVQCQFECKYKRSHTEASDDELREFEFEDEPAIPDASPTPSPTVRSPALSPSPPTNRFIDSPATPIRNIGSTMARDSTKKAETPAKAVEATPTKAPTSRVAPETREVLASEHAEVSERKNISIRRRHCTDFPLLVALVRFQHGNLRFAGRGSPFASHRDRQLEILAASQRQEARLAWPGGRFGHQPGLQL
jgi:hypothetical protein